MVPVGADACFELVQPAADLRQYRRVELFRRRGRRAGIAVYSLLVGGFTVVCAAQIIGQVWGRPEPSVLAVTCREGTSSLIAAIRRSQKAAQAETRGERAAVTRFRAELQPEWGRRAAVVERCRGDRPALRALREIDRLRYAEEHAVRYEAVELARRRRRIRAVEARLFGGQTRAIPSHAPPARSAVADRPLSH